MQIQGISGFTNPIQRLHSKHSEQPKQNEQSPKNQTQGGDVFTRTEDGHWLGREIDFKTGEAVDIISKYNWNENGVLDSREVTRIPANNLSMGVKTIVDYENNTVSESNITNTLLGPEIKTLTTVKKDPVTGKIIAKETYAPSDIPGIFNVTEVDALGRKKVLTSAIKTPEGGMYISKNLTSLDGTTTTYRYKKDASGNHISMFNQIADKYGNVLSTVDRTYDRESDTLAHSSINGRKYTIEKNGKNTVVTDEFWGTKTVLNEKKFKVPFYQKPLLTMLGKLQGYTPEESKESVTDDLLKTLPGDTLIKMTQDVRYIVPLKDDLDSAFMGYFAILNCGTDEFVVNHELGHSQDGWTMQEFKDINETAEKAEKEGTPVPEFLKNPIADNPQFIKEYVFEKAAFVKAFPTFKEEYIDYFIFETNGQLDRGRKETVAETNAINGQNPVPPEILAMRTQVLQQYFPRTIAVANKLTTPIAIPEKP